MRMRRAMKAAIGSVFIGLLVLAMKFAAWRLTGSIALYSDALESVINVAAALAAVVAINVSAKPADAEHPFGHHKAEYLSAVLEGVLIVIAALSIMREAWLGFLDPEPISAPLEGLVLNGGATLLNAVWATVLVRAGRGWRSPALAADGKHLMTDVVTSIGVLAGVILVPVTGWLLLDPILAALVAVNILWTGYGLVRESVGGLMDRAADADTLEAIRSMIADTAEGALEAHDLRTRHAGRITFIEFHLVVPGDMTVSEAHRICDRVEGALHDAADEAHITIHVEPDDKAKQHGVLVL